jgi:hypothetical protein
MLMLALRLGLDDLLKIIAIITAIIATEPKITIPVAPKVEPAM